MKSLAIIFFATLLVACGGGGGGGGLANNTPTPAGPLTGIVAADGSPMSYGQVRISSLVDSTSASSTADIDGNASIPTSGVTFPAIVKVTSSSGNKTLYGYIASSSQTNAPVNPLSTLVLTIASNGNPSLITSTSQLTSSAITTAKTAVSNIFANIFSAFSVSSTQDLLSENFTTNHTGIDLVLDALSVTFDATGNPTICTKLLNTCKSLTLASLDTTAIAISAAEVSSINSAPIASCSNLINNFTSTSLTTNSAAYASSFLNSGLNAASYQQAMVKTFNGITAKFKNPVLIGSDANNNYLFAFDSFNSATDEFAGSFATYFNVVDGSCAMVGDQLPFALSARSSITVQTRVDGTNNSAVTTSAPVIGLTFGGGGDGFGGTSVQNTITVNGSSITISSIKFYFCNATNNCSNFLMQLYKAPTNNGYYYLPNNVNTLPLKSYASAGINTANDFYNGNPNPIKVELLDSNSVVQKSVYLKVSGRYIPSDILNTKTLPSITNSQTVLASTGTNPTLNINIPNGFIVQRVGLTTSIMNSSPQQITTVPAYVLSSTSISKTLSATINQADDYRSITMGGSTTEGIPVNIKYVWSPTCTGCS